MNDYELARAYSDFVKKVNSEWPPDEYCALAARDALTEAYGLNAYHEPPLRKICKHAATTAANEGGVFVSGKGGEPPCPV